MEETLNKKQLFCNGHFAAVSLPESFLRCFVDSCREVTALQGLINLSTQTKGQPYLRGQLEISLQTEVLIAKLSFTSPKKFKNKNHVCLSPKLL